MRILHVLDHSLPLHSGYTFRTRALLLDQRRLGWETLHLTTPRHVKDGPDPEVIDGLTFHRTPRPGGGLPIVNEVQATARALDRIAAEWKPDIKIGRAHV